MDFDSKGDVGIEDASIREDLRGKFSAQVHSYQSSPAIDDELKVILTIETSKACVPGAFRDNESDAKQSKRSLEHTVNYTRMKQAQKARGYVDRESERPECTSIDEEQAIDDLNENMNSFMHVTNITNAKEDHNRAKRKNARHRMILCGGIALLILVCSCVGVLAGMKTGKDHRSKDTPGTFQKVNTTDKCYVRPIHQQSARFTRLRSKLLSQVPEMADAIDMEGNTARVALCWLADSDGFQIDITQHVLDRFVLAVLYHNFVGTQNSMEMNEHALTDAGWMAEVSVCFWKGVECESNNTQVVTRLNLQNMRLGSSIPTELFLLTNLVEIDLSQNDLTGEIPAQVGALTSLTTLRLDFNKLSGQLPSEIFGLTQLEVLGMKLDFLSGTIPEQLTSSTRLVSLVMTGMLKGTIPELSKLSNLKVLELNKMIGLVGTVPDFSRSTNLEVLSLLFAGLTGTLPSSIWSFSNMTTLRLKESQLWGTIPNEIGYLSRLKLLQLPSAFNGTIPSEMGLLSHLETLSLPKKMTGTLPSEVCSFPNLKETDITCTQCACCSEHC